MFAGDGFGPAGPVTDGAPPFTVAGPTQVALDAARRGTGSFTVSNVTGRPVRARVLVLPAAGSDAAWFQVAGTGEIALPTAGTAVVDVAVSVPAGAPTGPGAFQLGVALEEAPDQIVHGPTVAFQVAAETKRRFPWWIIIVATAAVLLLLGGGLLIWRLTRPPEVAPIPSDTATTTQPSRPVLTSGSFRFETGYTDADLETGTVTAGIREGADISLQDSDLYGDYGGWPLMIYGYTGGVALVEDADFLVCRSVFLSESVEIPDGPGTVSVCAVTSDNRIAMLQISGVPDEHSIRDIAYTVWE